MGFNTAALTVVLAVVLTAAMTSPVVGKSSSSAPAPVDCTSVVLSMADCLSYVTNDSKVDKPEGNCCSGLKQVLKSNPDCLCQAFKSSSQFGVVLNVTKALSLPDACHVHAPSATKCGLSISPAGAPDGAIVSPAGAPSGVSMAPSSGFGPSEISPASPPAKTGASSTISISVELIIAGIAAAFFSGF